jgi:hypothetical protein
VNALSNMLKRRPGFARLASLPAVLIPALTLFVGVSAAAKAIDVAPTDLIGKWILSKDGQDSTVTLSADGTFAESSPSRQTGGLGGLWKVEHGSLVWAYTLPAGVKLSGVRTLTIYRVVEAAPERIVLRQSNGTVSTLSRNVPKTASSSPEVTKGTLPITLVGLAILCLLAIVTVWRLCSRGRSQRRGGPMVRPAPRQTGQPAARCTTPVAETPRAVAEPSDELMAAIWEAVGHGMQMIQASGGPLNPFMFQWKGEARTQKVLMGESMEDSVAMGKELARDVSEDVDGCVIAWDGYVTIAGERSDALFFQAYERGDKASHVLVQRYEPSPEAYFRVKGNVALIEHEAPLFGREAPGGSRTVGGAWGPLARRSRADVHNIVVADPTTGRHSVHFTITAGRLEDAREAIIESFDTIVSSLRANPDFGGEVAFVVYGPAPSTAGLPTVLAQAASQIEERITASGLKTARGEPLRVQIQQKKSAF